MSLPILHPSAAIRSAWPGTRARAGRELVCACAAETRGPYAMASTGSPGRRDREPREGLARAWGSWPQSSTLSRASVSVAERALTPRRAADRHRAGRLRLCGRAVKRISWPSRFLDVPVLLSRFVSCVIAAMRLARRPVARRRAACRSAPRASVIGAVWKDATGKSARSAVFALTALRRDAQALAYWITAFSAAITSAWCVASAKWPASSMMIRRFFGAETLLKYASTSGVGAKRSCRPWMT
jgi:hypothetical protein